MFHSQTLDVCIPRRGRNPSLAGCRQLHIWRAIGRIVVKSTAHVPQEDEPAAEEADEDVNGEKRVHGCDLYGA